MKLKVYAILDLAVGSFNRPFYLQANAQAVRSFYDEVQRTSEDNPMWKHPEDFELFELGVFDDEGALWDILPQPMRIARGIDVRPQKSVAKEEME